jgi:putative tryptophan/tyrosine transport system substrate-binding protein
MRLVRRREFITLLGGAAVAWPIAVRTEQLAMPVIGSLHAASDKGTEHFMDAFRQGLKEAGYVEGQNVKIEYRWADGAYDRLSSLTNDLLGLRINVLVPFGTSAIRVVKVVYASSAAEIPIVFAAGNDPVADGIVASLNRPGGNITGITSIASELGSKRLGLLRELLPDIRTISLLVNTDNSIGVNERKDAQAAAVALGRELEAFAAKNERDLELAFEMSVRRGAGAMIIVSDTFFLSRMARIAELANQYKLPTLAPYREFAMHGGLVSYGANIHDLYRLAGIYTARVLKGTKPRDLPVLQPTTFDLVINLRVAKTLALDVPPMLLARADEVIE